MHEYQAMIMVSTRANQSSELKFIRDVSSALELDDLEEWLLRSLSASRMMIVKMERTGTWSSHTLKFGADETDDQGPKTTTLGDDYLPLESPLSNMLAKPSTGRIEPSRGGCRWVETDKRHRWARMKVYNDSWLESFQRLIELFCLFDGRKCLLKKGLTHTTPHHTQYLIGRPYEYSYCSFSKDKQNDK